jgi:hypothetical protein
MAGHAAPAASSGFLIMNPMMDQKSVPQLEKNSSEEKSSKSGAIEVW